MPDEPFTAKEGESWESKFIRDLLRKPFKPEQMGKIPPSRGRPALDFVGHAAVTDRLNKIAPDWTYTIDDEVKDQDTYWIRMTMTIGEVSRSDYGDGKDPKEAIGNAIRRCAMRFGVGIDLWSREELESSAPEQSPPGAARGSGVDTVAPGGSPLPPGDRTSVTPGATTNDPLTCTHHYRNGNPAKVTKDGKQSCRLCGMDWIAVVEGTTKDLGAA